jgi:hypothetical protein
MKNVQLSPISIVLTFDQYMFSTALWGSELAWLKSHVITPRTFRHRHLSCLSHDNNLVFSVLLLLIIQKFNSLVRF